MNFNNHARRAIAVATFSAIAVVAAGAAGAAEADVPDVDDGQHALAAASPPTAPRSPTATPANGAVRLTWLPSASDGGSTVDLYRVQRSLSSSGPWKTIATPTARNHTATGSIGIRYYFRVAAHNSAGWGNYGKVVSAVPRSVSTAPRSVTAVPGNTIVELDWLAPSDSGGANIDLYRVQRSLSSSGPWTTIATPTGSSQTVTGSNGTRYYFRVAAHNAAGWSPYSTVVNTVPRTVPTAPTSPAVAPGNESATLSWLAPTSNGGAPVDRYRVQRSSTSSGPWTTIATPTALTFGDTGLTNGNGYHYRIAAHNAAGYGPYSAVVSTVLQFTVPTAPEACNADQVFGPGSTSMLWSWDPPSSDGGTPVEWYRLELRRDNVLYYWWGLPTTSPRVLSVQIPADGGYEAYVAAVNAKGQGAWCTDYLYMAP